MFIKVLRDYNLIYYKIYPYKFQENGSKLIKFRLKKLHSPLWRRVWYSAFRLTSSSYWTIKQNILNRSRVSWKLVIVPFEEAAEYVDTRVQRLKH